MPPRRPVATVRPRPQLPQVPFRGLFREPEYDNGPYAREDEEDDD
jgi:hypothetical protein